MEICVDFFISENLQVTIYILHIQMYYFGLSTDIQFSQGCMDEISAKDVIVNYMVKNLRMQIIIMKCSNEFMFVFHLSQCVHVII